MKLIWGPIHFQGVFKYNEGIFFSFFFFQEIYSNNSLGDKRTIGHFFNLKQKSSYSKGSEID